MASITQHKNRNIETGRAVHGIAFWLSSPAAGLLIPSLFIAFLYLSRIIELAWPPLNKFSMPYLIGGIIVVCLISWATLRFFRDKKIDSTQRVHTLDDWLKLWWPFLILGLIGGISAFIDFYTTLDYTSLDLNYIRGELPYRDPTLLAYFSNFFAPFSLMVLGITLIAFEELRGYQKLLGLVVGISVPFVLSIGLAGRAHILDLLILTPWWFLQRPLFRKSIIPGRKIGLISGIILVSIFFWVLAWVSTSRSVRGENQFLSVLDFNQVLVNTSLGLYDFLFEINPTTATAVSEGIYYWSTSVPAFDILFDNWDQPPDYIRVLSPFLYRRLGRFGLPSTEEIHDSVAAIFIKFRVFPNRFQSSPFIYLASFGRVGALVFEFILAFVASRVFLRGRKERSFPFLYLSSLFFLNFFLWFQYPATLYPLHEFGFYWCIAFIFYGWLTKPATIQAPANRSVSQQ